MLLWGMLAQVAMKPETPKEFWPLSIMGWIAVISGISGWVVALRRANNKPILDAIQSLREHVDREVRRIETKIDESDRRNQERNHELNLEIERNAGAVATQAERMIRSEEDRKQINQRLAASEGRMETAVAMIQGVERSLRDRLEAQEKAHEKAMRDQTKEILDAMGRMIRTGRNP